MSDPRWLTRALQLGADPSGAVHRRTEDGIAVSDIRE